MSHIYVCVCGIHQNTCTYTHAGTHTHTHTHTQIEVSAHIDGCMAAVAHTLIVGDAVNNKSTR